MGENPPSDSGCAPRKAPPAGIPCRKGLIGRSNADAHRRSASSDRERRISTWTRIRRAMAGARESYRAGIPCRKGLIGRSSADAHRRSTSSDPGRRIYTWARIRRAMAGSPEALPRRHSVLEGAHRPVERRCSPSQHFERSGTQDIHVGENPPSIGGEPGSATAPAFRAGRGSSAGRALMLTVEMHSAASRFGRRISTR